MRSLAFVALLGSSIAVTLTGQSLTEHAAAAAGATIGTAAGKPLGTALGKVFGDTDKVANKAAAPRTTKPVAKPAEEAADQHPGAVVVSSGGGGAPTLSGGAGSSGGGSSSAAKPAATVARHSVRHREAPIESEYVPAPPAPALA